MQITDYFYKKNLYQPLRGKAKKPATVLDVDWEVLDKKSLDTIRLSLLLSTAFNISEEKTTKDLMTALS